MNSTRKPGSDFESTPGSRAKWVFIAFAAIAGYFLIAEHKAHEAQHQHRLATTGPYARLRHPQYLGFILIMFGFLLQWPTLVTLLMFPILVFMYARLALIEEREVRKQFGDEYVRYAEKTPRFIPRFSDLARNSPEKNAT